MNVDIEVWKGTDVFTVPSTALFHDGQNWAVFVVRDGRAHLRRVVTGRSDNRRTVIEHGLQAGDEVVLQPSDMALAIAGLVEANGDVVRSSYVAKHLTTWFVIVPLCLGAFASGVVQSLGTLWGCFATIWS